LHNLSPAMSLFENFRQSSFKKQLLKNLNQQNRLRKTNTIWSARSIGILFECTDLSKSNEVLDFANALEREGKKVSLLGYNHQKKELSAKSYPTFNRSTTTWNGKTKPNVADNFINQKFDLLLVINMEQRRPIEWISANAQAAMKIGSFSDMPHDFDIMLETPNQKSITFFLEQLDFYLDKIVLTHEYTFAKT
jgi:hypothetical protein